MANETAYGRRVGSLEQIDELHGKLTQFLEVDSTTREKLIEQTYSKTRQDSRHLLRQCDSLSTRVTKSLDLYNRANKHQLETVAAIAQELQNQGRFQQLIGTSNNSDANKLQRKKTQQLQVRFRKLVTKVGVELQTVVATGNARQHPSEDIKDQAYEILGLPDSPGGFTHDELFKLVITKVNEHTIRHNGEASELRSQLTAKDDEITSNHETIRAMEEKQATFDTDVESLRNEVKTLKEQKVEAENQARDVKSAKVQIEERLSETTTKFTELQETVKDQLDKGKADLQTKITSLEAELSNLKREKELADRVVEDLNKQLVEATSGNDALNTAETMIKDLDETVEKQAADLTNEKSKNNKLKVLVAAGVVDTATEAYTGTQSLDFKAFEDLGILKYLSLEAPSPIAFIPALQPRFSDRMMDFAARAKPNNVMMSWLLHLADRGVQDFEEEMPLLVAILDILSTVDCTSEWVCFVNGRLRKIISASRHAVLLSFAITLYTLSFRMMPSPAAYSFATSKDLKLDKLLTNASPLVAAASLRFYKALSDQDTSQFDIAEFTGTRIFNKRVDDLLRSVNLDDPTNAYLPQLVWKLFGEPMMGGLAIDQRPSAFWMLRVPSTTSSTSNVIIYQELANDETFWKSYSTGKELLFHDREEGGMDFYLGSNHRLSIVVKAAPTSTETTHTFIKLVHGEELFGPLENTRHAKMYITEFYNEELRAALATFGGALKTTIAPDILAMMNARKKP